MKKAIYIISGITILIIAAIGIVIPGVPTTPLLLLTLYCFGKSSESLTEWFKKTSLYKRYLSEYVQKRSLTFRQKLLIQIFASIMMVISFITIQNLIFRIILASLFFIHHYVFIFRIKTYKSNDLQNEKCRLMDKSLKGE